jgi:hypothetical protein
VPQAVVEPREWLTGEALRDEFRKQFADGYYPDASWGRCEDGLLKYRTHWAARPPGLRVWFQRGAFDDKFDAKASELSAQGFALQYDNASKDCEGRTPHQALWAKSAEFVGRLSLIAGL